MSALSANSPPNANRILNQLPPEEYKRLSPHLEPVTLSRGDVLYYPQDPVSHVHFPNCGTVSVVATFADGGSVEVGVVGNEGVFGINVVLGSVTTPHEAMVQLPGDGVRASSDVLRREFKQGGQLQDLLLRYTQAFIVQIAQTAACNKVHPLDGRLARWLLMTRDRAMGGELELTHGFMAVMLGSRRAGVTEAAGRIQDAGLIRYRRGRVTVLDRRGLEAVSCECYPVVKKEFERLWALTGSQRETKLRLRRGRQAVGRFAVESSGLTLRLPSHGAAACRLPPTAYRSANMTRMRIRPAVRLRGRVRVPGDKSVSHRAAILAALAGGPTRIENFASSADCASTLGALGGLGVRVERDGGVVFIEGAGAEAGGPRFRPPSAPLDCGNSGTTMRLLAGVLAAQPFASTLVGDESLSSRPMLRVTRPLEQMGARVEAVDGHAPLRVEGRRPLRPLRYEMPVASAQVKSCVLLAGLGAEGRTEVVEPLTQSRDHTERMLRWFGVNVETRELTGGESRAGSPEGRAEGGTGGGTERASEDARRVVVSLDGGARLRARDLTVPGDISSAAFPVAAALMLPGSELELVGVGLNPTRTALLDALRSLGATLGIENEREQSNEPAGDIRVLGGGGRLAPARVGANVIRGAAVAQLIDELPVLAVLGTRVEGGLEIRDARELRVKESDRISATVENLRAMGARVEEFEDGLRVAGPSRLRGARLRSFGDHRIAMAFAVAALTAEGETEIEGAEECVPVSFPEFFPLLESLTEG